jgi:hypothetical protein
VLKLPFIERNHGPIGDVLEHVHRESRVAVSPFAGYLARSHAVSQGVAAAVRVARAQSLRAEAGEPDLVYETTSDALLALVEASSEMFAEESERLAEWVEVAALAHPGKVDAASFEGKEATDG